MTFAIQENQQEHMEKQHRICQHQMQSISEVHGHMKTGNSTTTKMKKVSSKI